MSRPLTWALIGGLWLTGCASPSQRFDETAAELAFSSQQVDGTGFSHRIFQNPVARTTSSGRVLHVYLDGDGSPWRNHFPEDDPTSRNPLILRMMAKDPAPAILLGRPCYHGLNQDPACDRRFWTSNRYSQTVVDSMVAALRHWLATRNYSELVLIGFSGGGVLASLIAPEITNIVGLVTVAGNLDVKAWSEAHGYPPLKDSLNPIDRPKLPPHIKQLHLAGTEDDNVLPAIVKAYADKQGEARYVEYRQQHGCCWDTIWPEPLQLLN